MSHRAERSAGLFRLCVGCSQSIITAWHITMKKNIKNKALTATELRRAKNERASTLQEALADLQTQQERVGLSPKRLPWEPRWYSVKFRPVVPNKSGWLCGQKTGKYHRPYVKLIYVPQ